MKKFIIVITFKKMQVVRMLIGAMNAEWAQRVAEGMMVSLWQSSNRDRFDSFSCHLEEMKSNVDVE